MVQIKPFKQSLLNTVKRWSYMFKEVRRVDLVASAHFPPHQFVLKFLIPLDCHCLDKLMQL